VTAQAILLCIGCQLLIVVGQLLLKHAVAPTHGSRWPARGFALGVTCMACWFFLWLGLMSKWDLSKLFPFEGLNPAMMAIAARVVLKERLPRSAWIGVALICLGIAVVSRS
jgi:drug/metabolite transporter (DMT)-like permease